MAGAEAKEEDLLSLLSDTFIEDVEAGNKSVDARKSRGQTALMISIEFPHQPNGGLTRISKLISLGADLWARDSNNEMAIHYTSRYGSKSVLKLILNEILTWDKIDREQYINSRGGGNIPLQLACLRGTHKKIQMLIDAGADIERRTGVENMPAVYYSAQLGQLGVVKKFPLEMLSKFYSLSGDEYRTILFGAVVGNELDVVSWLLWRKVPVEIPGRKSIQPIDMAIGLSDLAIFKFLLKYTPYHQIMRKAQQWVVEGRIDVYEELMTYIKTRNMDEQHSVGLLAAAISVNYEHPYARKLADPTTAEPPEIRTDKNTMAKDLIQMGAPLNLIIHHNQQTMLDSMHITLLTLACINKNTEVIECMLRAGADPNIGQHMRPLGILLNLLIPNPTHGHAPWLEAWPLIQLCLDNGASPTAIYGPDYKGGGLQDANLFTASIYASYLNYNKTFIKALIRDFIPRGLGFKVSWLNGHGNPSKLVSRLFKSRAIWKDAHYDEEEEIYVLTSSSKCPQGCQMWGCEHDEAPVRLNTKSCKHIICAGHMRKLIEMNEKNNAERKREGGNQLPLKCPVCRKNIEDIQLMSHKQIEHWHVVENKIKASFKVEKKQIEFQNFNLKALYKLFEPKISKRQRALERVRARVQDLEGEIRKIENNKNGFEKFHIQKKKEHQAHGLDERKQLRKKQLLDKCSLHF